ncbi:unnamed protein product [Brachionus calyciflorus]|uniref:Uncharacterized protein n=1 Tax=Brachionus calyciflorus TaxID=104777 RepID=A0A813MPC2_9BILA|nr:unnamed protein product [Brachionus calyciflorus]
MNVADQTHSNYLILKQNLNSLIDYLNLNDVNLIYEKLINIEQAKSTNSNTQDLISNISQNLHDEAWINFASLNAVYSFENNLMNWLGCSLYFAYEKLAYITRKKYLIEKQNQITSNKKNSNAEKQNNQDALEKLNSMPFFSIVKLLKFLNLDLSEFLKLSKQMIEMLNVPNDLCNRLIQIEANFNVSSVLFLKYTAIFKNVFNCAHENLIKFFSNGRTDNKNYHKKLYASKYFDIHDLFDVDQFPQLSNDLVNSYHLLICCINFLYENMSNLNETYIIKLDKNKSNRLIDHICTKYDGNAIEIKTINKYYFKPQVKQILLNLNLTTLDNDDIHFKISEIKLLKIFNFKLNRIYARFLLKQNEETNEIRLNNNNNNHNELDNFRIDIDERVFINLNQAKEVEEEEFNEMEHDDEMEDRMEIELDNLNINSRVEFNFKLPECLQTLLKFEALSSEFEPYSNLIDDFVKNKCTLLFKEFFINEIFRNLDELRIPNSSEIKEYLSNLLDAFFDLTNKFYLVSLEIMVSNEKKRIGGDNSRELLKKLIQNESFQKCLYICCFEILLNFSHVIKITISHDDNEQTSVNKTSNIEKFINLIQLKSAHFEFPFSLNHIDLNLFDLLRIIEIFITNTSINQQQLQQPPNSQKLFLNKEMIKHLNMIEEKILEQFAWKSDSNIWNLIHKLKLANPNIHSEMTQLNFPFPLYDEVGLLNGQQITNLNSSGSILSAAVLTNCTNNENSQTKPTITRVVCSTNSSTTTTVTNDNMILTTKTVSGNNSTKQIQVLTLTPTSNKSSPFKQGRLLNLNNYLIFFFRKFYNLANLRLRNMIDKLNFVNIITEPTDSSSPNITPSASTPVLTPVTSSSNQTFKPQQMSEKNQVLIKKIWNLFEYSLSEGIENKCDSLIKNRHLDQLLICSIYLTLKLSEIPILFTDILKCYKNLNNKNSSHVYREVVFDQNSSTDLITFYNQIYVMRLRNYALQLNGKFNSQQVINNLDNKLIITPVNNLLLLSPVPKPTTVNLNMNVQFTSRKVLDDHLVFISPCRDRLSSNNVQLIQPISGRNKLVLNLNDLNWTSVLKQMNDMIKKNEVKIKTSNKRLFSEISSHNVIPTNSPVVTSVVNCRSSSTSEDERDGRAKITRINSFGNSSMSPQKNSLVTNLNRSGTNFLSKIVNSKLGSTSNSNLITMVVNSGSNSSNFTRRLQTIQTDRTNLN